MIARWLLVLAVLAAAACGGSAETLRMGTKGFVEQRIVAEIAAGLLRAEADVRLQQVDCGDTYGCQQALRSGKVDVLVEYSGTGALFLGIDPADAEHMAALRRAYQTRGVEWRHALGFDNGYRLVVSSRQAGRLGLRSIADLATLDGGIRVACPRTYLKRPGDGLAALLERYGLRLRGEPLVLREPAERVEAVLLGRADVAVAYATDGALRSSALEVLEDSLGFFPRYDAALLVREQRLGELPAAAAALAKLEGAITTGQMRQMNYAVQVEGWQPRDAARRFLSDADLVQPSTAAARSRLELVVAVSQVDQLQHEATVATRALRKVFADRPVALKPTADPARLVASGRAKLALVGAERFFEIRGHQGLVRTKELDAVAVVGSRMVHVLRAELDPETPLAGRVGIAAPESGAGRIGRQLLAAVGRQPAARGTIPTLVEQLREGAIDVVLAVARPEATAIAEALEPGDVRLVELSAVPLGALPYLRRSRLAANTYPHQDEPVDTLAAQVLLAGPSRRPHLESLKAGPGSAMLVEVTPLPIEEVDMLAEATGVAELPDPMLPGPWSEPLGPADAESANRVVDTVLNALVLLFLVWLGLAFARGPKQPKAPAEAGRSPD